MTYVKGRKATAVMKYCTKNNVRVYAKTNFRNQHNKEELIKAYKPQQLHGVKMPSIKNCPITFSWKAVLPGGGHQERPHTAWQSN